MMDMKKFLCYAIGAVSSLCLLSCQKDDMKDGLFQQGTLLGNYEFVDLGLSVKWASCNIGAEKPNEFGDYYAWGETETKETYTFDNYQFQHTEILPVECDVARAKMGDGWRMPTNAEVQELLDKCEWRIRLLLDHRVFGRLSICTGSPNLRHDKLYECLSCQRLHRPGCLRLIL